MRVLRTVAALALLFFVSGCALMKPLNDMTHYMKTAFRPKGLDYQMSADEATGEWDQVAIEGRGDRPRAESKDPLYWLDSPKHREIKRNLGYSD